MNIEGSEKKLYTEEGVKNEVRALNNRYDTFAWGAFFILIGILIFIPGDQGNEFLLGIGIILLGLNLVRRINRIPTNIVTIILGMMALVPGIISLLRPVLNIPRIEVDLFPIFFIVIGLYFLGCAIKRTEN